MRAAAFTPQYNTIFSKLSILRRYHRPPAMVNVIIAVENTQSRGARQECLAAALCRGIIDGANGADYNTALRVSAYAAAM